MLEIVRAVAVIYASLHFTNNRDGGESWIGAWPGAGVCRRFEDAAGIAVAVWTPGQRVGAYSATAEVPSSTRRRITFEARVYDANTVLFATNQGYSFRSARNGSSPAVDSIGVGDTLIWRLDPYDYDERDVDTDQN